MLETAAQDGATTQDLGSGTQEEGLEGIRYPNATPDSNIRVCASMHPGLRGEGCDLTAKGLTRTDASTSKPAHVSVVTTVAINKQGLYFFFFL